MKFNKKGQGALEYLLLIGGAVLIAVIVIALLVGMGSQNSENSKTRNEEAMNATNVPIPSVINTAKCADANANIAINWTPVVKAGNVYAIIVNDTDIIEKNTEDEDIVETMNPILIKPAGTCVPGTTTVAIRTTNGTAVLSAKVIAQ